MHNSLSDTKEAQQNPGWTRPLKTEVKKRAVFFIGGYDPKSPESFFDRMDRELGRFQKLWGIEVEGGERKAILPDVNRKRYSASGEGWSTQTDIHFLSLDDIVLKDFADSFLTRLGRYLVTMTDYFISGTGFAIFRQAWRFGIYFCYPLFMLFLIFLVSLLLASIVLDTNIAFSKIISVVVFASSFFAITKIVGKRLFVLHLMDLWSFSRNYLRQNRDDIHSKLDRFASEICNTSRKGTYDELIMVGHSTGGALILDSAARALEKDPALTSRNTKVSVLTVGSTALKIGMHPAGGWFRDRVATLVNDPEMGWVEYQCHTDIINFYKSDPVSAMKLGQSNPPKPIVGRIRIKDMLAKDVYQRIRRNLFRVHYQFVFGNNAKYHYDFPAICVGPALLQSRARYPAAFSQSLHGGDDGQVKSQ